MIFFLLYTVHVQLRIQEFQNRGDRAEEFLVSGDCLDFSTHIAYTHSLCFWRKPGLYRAKLML